MTVYMDEDLLWFDEVWAAAGRVDAVFPADPQALKEATAAIVAKLKTVF